MSYEVLIGRGIPYQQTNHTVIRVSCFFVGFHFVIVGFWANSFFIKEVFFWYVLRPFSDLIVCESIQACRHGASNELCDTRMNTEIISS